MRQGNKSRQLDQRRHRREPLRDAVTVSWIGPEGEISCIGNGADLSVYGALIETPHAIGVGTKVRTRIGESDRYLEANVRHHRKYSTWYRVGLEFTSAQLHGASGHYTD